MPVLSGIYFAPTGLIDDPPVVLIHGAYGSHLDWPAALRRMKGARVLALDLPGHGKSAKPGRNTISDYAGDVLRFLDALHVECALFVGHSMGGAIAQMLALDFTERVTGLVLIGTAARLLVNPAILANLLTDTDGIARKIARWVWSLNAPPEAIQHTYAQIMALDPLITLGDFQACSTFDVMNRVRTIHVPTLIIVGAEDRMVPYNESGNLAAQIKGAQYVRTPNTGHMVTLEASAAVAAAIDQWRTEHAQKNG